MLALAIQCVRKEAEQHSSLKVILYCPNWLQLWNLAHDSGRDVDNVWCVL